MRRNFINGYQIAMVENNWVAFAELLLNIGPKANGAIAAEQENRLREMAAWYFINREVVDDVRPWVINKENNIWYTEAIDKKTVYAIVTDAASWPEGE